MTKYITGKLLSDMGIAMSIQSLMADVFRWTSYHSAIKDQTVLIIIDELQGYNREDIQKITQGRCKVIHIVEANEESEHRETVTDGDYELVYAETFTPNGIIELLNEKFSEGELRHGKR